MIPSTTHRPSASDHMPPLLQPNLYDTVWEIFQCPTLANQEYVVFLPRMEDVLIDEDLLELFRCAKRLLWKNPSKDRLAKIIFCFCSTLRDHVLFNKKSNDDRVFFREQTCRYSVVHLPSAAATISGPHSPKFSAPNQHDFSSGHTSGSRGLPTAHPSSTSDPLDQIFAPRNAPHEFSGKYLTVLYLTSPYSIPGSHTPSPLLLSDKTRNILSPPSIDSSTTSSSSSSTTTTPTFILMTPQLPFPDHHCAANAQSSPSPTRPFPQTNPPTLPQQTSTYLSTIRMHDLDAMQFNFHPEADNSLFQKGDAAPPGPMFQQTFDSPRSSPSPFSVNIAQQTSSATSTTSVSRPIPYKECPECLRRKRRCQAHTTIGTTKRNPPGMRCFGCKKDKKGCHGMPCTRCKRLERLCHVDNV